MISEIDPRIIRRIADMAAVYRMFDRDGKLLYIGKTGRAARFDNHAVKRFFPLVVAITLEWHDTEASALLAESRAISAERPRYNIAGNLGPRIVPPKPKPVPKPTPAPQRVPPQVTLSEAVRYRIVRSTCRALRMARHRDERFPVPVGKRGQAFLYDAKVLSAYDLARG